MKNLFLMTVLGNKSNQQIDKTIIISKSQTFHYLRFKIVIILWFGLILIITSLHTNHV